MAIRHYKNVTPKLGPRAYVDEAAVVIGDRALQVSRELPASAMDRYDLVSEWNALYGEPFVFALWAGSRSAIDAGLGGKSPEELVARLAREPGVRPFPGRHDRP